MACRILGSDDAGWRLHVTLQGGCGCGCGATSWRRSVDR